jgi:hypothetical protein
MSVMGTYYNNIVLLQKTKLDSLDSNMTLHRHSRVEKMPARIVPHRRIP